MVPANVSIDSVITLNIDWTSLHEVRLGL